MQDHRIAPRPDAVARPGTPEFEHQRRLLLELAVSAPREGDRLADLAQVLELAHPALEAAAEALVRAGLAERRGARLFASTATLAVEALWPLAL